jgi:hypothetical protein
MKRNKFVKFVKISNELFNESPSYCLKYLIEKESKDTSFVKEIDKRRNPKYYEVVKIDLGLEHDDFIMDLCTIKFTARRKVKTSK